MMNNWRLMLSLLVLICFIISLSVAANRPTTDAEGRKSYEAATAIFAVTGCVGSAILSYSLVGKSVRQSHLDKLGEKVSSSLSKLKET